MKCENCQDKIKVRTSKQNRALHLYLDLVAKELNAAGYTVQAVIANQMEIPFTKENTKELIWRPAQKAYVGKHSTTKIDTNEVDEVYDIVNRYLGEKYGVHVAFPSLESLESEM